MAIDYSKYPPDWKKVIRPRILARAGNQCEWCKAVNGQKHPETKAIVELAIAHLDHDPENWEVTDERLAALCQRCHLNYDRQDCMSKRVRGKKFGRNYLKNQFKINFLDE